MLSGVGAVAVRGDEQHRRHPAVAVSYGSGLALIVDEFALLLDLKDVYWARQGRISIDIGVGGIALTGCYFAALPVIRRLRRGSAAPGDRASPAPGPHRLGRITRPAGGKTPRCLTELGQLRGATCLAPLSRAADNPLRGQRCGPYGGYAARAGGAGPSGEEGNAGDCGCLERGPHPRRGSVGTDYRVFPHRRHPGQLGRARRADHDAGLRPGHRACEVRWPQR